MDVGLAICFTGTAYLVWALVAGVSRAVVQEMIKSTHISSLKLPELTEMVKIFFVDTGFVIDLVGLAWLVASMILVVLSSYQKISISWAWVSAGLQTCIAAAGAVLVSYASYQPHMSPASALENAETPLESVSAISLPVIVPIAVLLWVTCLIWLIVERSRLNRRGPSLRDGLKSNIQGSRF